MILKGSQRGGAGQLASHLLRTDENDHVEVEQMRGFVSDDLRGAFAEAYAVSKGTRCKQFLFSLSVNPPKGGEASIDDMVAAIDRAEDVLGLQGHPRAIVIHEKQGRRHAHAVWSRIDPREMKAVNLPYFKNHLAALSKELYLEHGWELPNGHRENGWKNPLNFNLAEWQHAKRLGLDPREIKQVFRAAWRESDDFASFRASLADKGFMLARGDRRGFVALDVHGEVFSVARMIGIKTKELEARLGKADARLPSVDGVRAWTDERLTVNLREALTESRRVQRRQMTPLLWQRRQMVRAQRAERVRVARAHRQDRDTRAKSRNTRIWKVLSGPLQIIAGALPFIRQQNWWESYDDYRRYRREIERLHEEQLEERRRLQRRIDDMHARQHAERLALSARIALLVRLGRDLPVTQERGYAPAYHALTLEM